MCLHGSQRIQDIHLSGTVFQEIHLVNCDFSFVVSDGRQRSTFRFQIVWQCFKHLVRNHRLM